MKIISILLLLMLDTGVSFANEVRMLMPADPLSLDPAIAEDDYALNILSNTMDGLMGYDENGKLENRLAEKMSIDQKGLRYTFTLRKNIKWSDGKPITASDFVSGMLRSLDPKTGSTLVSMIFCIRGSKDYNQKSGKAEAVAIRDENGKLVIELEKPTSYFPHLLTLSQTLPARKDILDANQGKWTESDPVTGAYQIVSHKRNQAIKLTVNESYWNFKPGGLPISLTVVSDESTALSLFESGNLDISNRIPSTEFARMNQKGVVKSFPHAATYFLSFNAKKPPFNKAEIRRAVSQSINREEILKALAIPHQKATTWIPPELEGYQEKLPFKTEDVVSPAEFEKLKKSPLEVSGAYNSNDSNRIIMERIQSDLKTKMNLTVSLSNMDWKTYVASIRSDSPQIYRYQRGAPFLDPIWHLGSFRGNDPNNFTGWKNAAYDDLVERISREPSGKKRQALISKAQQILVNEEAILVPIYFNVSDHLVSPKIKGYKMNPVGWVQFKTIRFEN